MHATPIDGKRSVNAKLSMPIEDLPGVNLPKIGRPAMQTGEVDRLHEPDRTWSARA
jgi:hypothetical protein